jgi:dTDP-4-amino-4,6-dideoxygalactose transaminase
MADEKSLVRISHRLFAISRSEMRISMKIPFSPPDITEEEIIQVTEALKSGWITTGPRTKELEREVASLCGVNRAVCLNSQTSCAEMTLRLLGIKDGDEVITSAYTYTASASVVCHVGAKLVLIDTQEDSLEMDYDKLAEAITERTKVIIPVDIGGIPCDYNRIYEIVESKKELFQPENELQKAFGRVIVMADAAHALGAVWQDKMVGSIADFTNFSFHAVKNLTTAEGGAVTWREINGIDSEKIYHQYQLLSLHGQSKDAFAKTQLGAWEYDIIGPWYKCNMTDVAAGIGLAQMKRYKGLLARRQKIIRKYDNAFIPVGIEVLKHYTNEYTSSGHLYITRIPDITQDMRNEIIIKMAEAGVACNVHYKPLPMLTAYKQLGFDIKDYPNAYRRFENEITLPLHTRLTDEEIDYVINQYIRIVREYIV